MHIKKSAKLQKPPFTDEQIALKAYQISQKNPESSPDENWDAAIKLLKKERIFQPLISIWRWTGIVEKKGWDIFQLLITASIPLLLFFGTQYFSQKNNEQQQQAATDKAQQETLANYLNQMFEAIKTDNLLSTKPDKKSFIIAQIRTITALQSLNPDRQRSIIQFLRAADLLNPDPLNLNEAVKKKPKTESHGLFYTALMPGINLKSIDLSGADLRGANLRGADLDRANLRGANLISADLGRANLRGANLSPTLLSSVFLSAGFPISADLSGADLSGADLSGANLSGADLDRANLSGANLRGADLSGTDLSGTNLRGADLSGTDLSGTNLSGANLSGANLTWMTNFSAKQIKSAKNWASAKYNGKRLNDPEVVQQLGLDAKP